MNEPLTHLRNRRTPTQLAVLVIFHNHRVHKAGRPTLPTLSDVALELGGLMTRADVMSHLNVLCQLGDIQHTGKIGPDCYQLTAQGRIRAKKQAEVMATREKRREQAAAARRRERAKPSYRSKPRLLPVGFDGVAR